MKKACLYAFSLCTLMSCPIALTAMESMEMNHEKMIPQENPSTLACECDAACENPSQQPSVQMNEPAVLATEAACNNPEQPCSQVQEPALLASDDTQGGEEVHILPYPPIA